MLSLLPGFFSERSEAGEIVLETPGLLSPELLVAEAESSVGEGVASSIDFSFFVLRVGNLNKFSYESD